MHTLNRFGKIGGTAFLCAMLVLMSGCMGNRQGRTNNAAGGPTGTGTAGGTVNQSVYGGGQTGLGARGAGQYGAYGAYDQSPTTNEKGWTRPIVGPHDYPNGNGMTGTSAPYGTTGGLGAGSAYGGGTGTGTNARTYSTNAPGTLDPNPTGATNASRVDVANRAAERVAALPEVRTANVLVTGNNAYVAAVLRDTNATLTKDVEGRIAQEVRSVQPGINNVYVTTNPGFINSVNNYVSDIQNGRPISGFIAQFGEMIRRVWPNPK